MDDDEDERGRVTEAQRLAERIRAAADDLMWCARERYVSDGDHVLKGGNELISLYVRPTAVEAAEIADGLEGVIAPIRAKRVRELIAGIRADLDALSRSDF